MDLPEEEKQLSQKEKLEKAQKLVSNNEYRNKRGTIMREVSGCLDQLLEKTKNRQQRANTIFSDMYLKLEIAIMILVILLLSICIIVRKLIVVPLVYYNKSIMKSRFLLYFSAFFLTFPLLFSSFCRLFLHFPQDISIILVSFRQQSNSSCTGASGSRIQR